MGTLAAVGQSTSRSARAAGREAAGSALEKLRGDAAFLLMFATTGYDQVELLAGIADRARGMPLSGCSAEGVIAQRLSDEGSHAAVVMAIASSCATFTTFLATGLAKDPRACGAALAEQVDAEIARTGQSGNRCLLLFPDGISGNCTDLVDGLQGSMKHPTLIVGGAAGANISTLKRTYQYHDGLAASDAVAAVLIRGDVAVEAAVSHGSTPIGSARTVTRSQGGTVYEIDGRPAWEVFKEYLDGDPTDLAGVDSLHLAFAERLPPELVGPYGKYVMHTPFGLDKESGALFFPGALRQGVKIQVARRDPDRIREGATGSALELAARGNGKPPSLVLHFDCAGRGRVIFGEQATATTVSGMQEALGREVPWLGFYTYGEIAPLKGKTFYHNHSVVLCALYDTEDPPPRRE